MAMIRGRAAINLAPPPEMTVSQWAEKYRRLDKSSALPGRWQNAATPYLAEIMDAFSDPRVRRVTFCKPTQVGGTEAICNCIGYAAMFQQAPAMIVLPDERLAKQFKENRLQRMIDSTPELKRRYDARRSNAAEARFSGMTLHLATSQSPAKLASKPVQCLFFDETDKHAGATRKEASSFELARERTKAFPHRSKIFDTCTPTVESGHIWRALQESDSIRHYFVPCPNCGAEIELLFGQIKWDRGGEGMAAGERADTACYFCQECGGAIEDWEKPRALQRGRWREARRNIAAGREPESVGYWLSTLYSPFTSWRQIAKEWLDSQGDPDRLQNFANSWLAEPWRDTAMQTDASAVLGRRTELREFELPEWAEILTGGIDVQKNSAYWAVRARGKRLTSQLVAHGQAPGLDAAADYMNLEYRTRSGEAMIVGLCAVDSGDGQRVDEIYEFCYENSEWAIPVKGSSQPLRGYYTISQIDRRGNAAHGMRLLIVDSDKYKDLIASRMGRKSGEGAWMANADASGEYAAQVASEERVRERGRNGAFRYRWVPKKSHAANHYLDCEVYCAAAADLMGVRALHLAGAPAGAAPAAPAGGGGARGAEPWIGAGGKEWLR
jgi:phage terminase large subunit GpA-like protein